MADKITPNDLGELALGLKMVMGDFFNNERFRQKLQSEGKDVRSVEFLDSVCKYLERVSELSNYMQKQNIESPTQNERLRKLVKDLNEYGNLENVISLTAKTAALLKELMTLNRSYKQEVTQLSNDIKKVQPLYYALKGEVLSELKRREDAEKGLIKLYGELKSYDHLPKIKPLDPMNLLGDTYNRMKEEFNKHMAEFVEKYKKFWSATDKIRDIEGHRKFIELSADITAKQERIDSLKAHRISISEELVANVERAALYDPTNKELRAVEAGNEMVDVIYKAIKALPQSKDEIPDGASQNH